MKILTVNAGSSSLKFNLISLPEEKELVSGNFEKIGLNGGIYSLKINGSKIQKEAEMKDHKVAIELLIKELLENNIIKSLDEIDGVGHRLVHGGDKYASSVIIDDEIKYEWLRIPHFYRPFYVYQYSTSLSIACFITENIISNKEGFKDKYLEFLSSGGKDYPLEVLKIIGIDLHDTKIFESAINTFKETLSDFKKIYYEEK